MPERILKHPLLRRLSHSGAILCYHGIAEAGDGVAAMHVSMASLKHQVDAARHVAELIPLREIVARHREGKSTSGLVAITFDDAYSSLLDASAWIRSAEIPLTVFPVNDAVQAGDAFWWDRMEVLSAYLSADGWHDFLSACGVPAHYRRDESGPLRLRSWIIETEAGRCPAQIQMLFADREQRLAATTVLRSMTGPELIEFAANPTVDVGVHTVSHPALPRLSDDDVRHEILAGQRELADRLGSVLPILSFPFGLYDERTVRLSRDAGMEASLILTGRNLSRTAADDPLSRFCVVGVEPTWKLTLKILGVVDAARGIYGRARGVPHHVR